MPNEHASPSHPRSLYLLADIHAHPKHKPQRKYHTPSLPHQKCDARHYLRTVIRDTTYHSCWRASFLAFCLCGRPAIYTIYIPYTSLIFSMYTYNYTHIWRAARKCQKPARHQLWSIAAITLVRMFCTVNLRGAPYLQIFEVFNI